MKLLLTLICMVVLATIGAQDTTSVPFAVESEGDLQVGEIYLLKQIHKVSGDQGPTKAGKRAAYSQYQVLIALEKLQLEHVFCEAISEDFVPDHPERKMEIGRMADVVKLIFPKGIPTIPNELQLEMLYELGGKKVYAYLHPKVTLHKVWTKEEAEEIEHAIEQSLKKGEFDMQLLLDVRERFAIREIKNFLTNHPGEKVGFIFGAAHSWAKYLGPDFNPRWHSADTTNMGNLSIDILRAEAEKTIDRAKRKNSSK